MSTPLAHKGNRGHPSPQAAHPGAALREWMQHNGPHLFTWHIFLVPILCNCTVDDASSEGLTDRRGNGSGRPRTRGLRCQPQALLFVLFPSASQTRPSIRSSVCEKICCSQIEESYTLNIWKSVSQTPLLRPGDISKYFPFTTLFLSTRP